jgi:transcriptional regulator with XRE-family HTH domain
MNRYEALRCSRELTQEQVADGSGVSRGTIIRLENLANPRPSHKVARALAEFYGVTVADLVGVDAQADAA